MSEGVSFADWTPPAVEMGTSDLTGAMGPLSPVITPDGRYYAFVYARRLSDLYVVEGLR